MTAVLSLREAMKAVQPRLGRGTSSIWQPSGNSTVVPGVVGMIAHIANGTVTARNVATTSKTTRQRRLGYVSAAGAGSLAGQHQTSAQIGLGDGAGNGGFLYLCRFVPSDAAPVAGAMMLVGLRSAVGVPSAAEPSTLTNVVGVGARSTDTNLQLFCGGSAAQAPVDLAANFPAHGLSTDLYELTLYAPPMVADTIEWQVRRLNTGHIAKGRIGPGTPGVTQPAVATLLNHVAYRYNNATALAVGIDIGLVAIHMLDE